MAQPSKGLNLFPRPSGTEGLVLGSLNGSTEMTRNYPQVPRSGMNAQVTLHILIRGVFRRCVPDAQTIFPTVSDVSKRMSLPLNGFCQDSEAEPLSYSPEQADRLKGPVENWPDWSEPEEGEDRDDQPVLIHIQASKSVNPVNSRLPLSSQNIAEEPWDDFEDTEPTSDLSPTAPLSDPVILTTPRGGNITPVKHTTEAPRLGSSKPLKLSSSTTGKTTSTWDNVWAEEEGGSQNPSNPKPKPTGVPKGGGIGGLGEEFTIKVKKKPQQDPELDLFADMVPDIKLSSPALLLIEDGSVCDAGLTAFTEDDTSLKLDSYKNTVTLSAKFAAASQPEVSVCGGVHVFGHVFWDYNSNVSRSMSSITAGLPEIQYTFAKIRLKH